MNTLETWLVPTLLSLASLYLVLGVDDLLIDFVALGNSIKPKELSPQELFRLSHLRQKKIAVLVPAWKESNIISEMLRGNLENIAYQNYHIFVGCYPNDLPTFRAVLKVSQETGRVTPILNSIPGPTSKGQLLNFVLRELTENRYPSFDVFLFHDAEDIIHPLALPLINSELEQADFVQIPVFSLPTEGLLSVGATYMDEFAEVHTRDLLVRQHLGVSLPSAGVGFAISRRALSNLTTTRDSSLFDPSCLTEDYLLGMRTGQLGLKQSFPCVFRKSNNGQKDWIATSEFQVKLGVSGQHRELLQKTLEPFAIPIDWHLNLMRPNQPIEEISVRCLESIPQILIEYEPDLVLVQGDTTTAVMAGLSSFLKKIPVVHIEAGLRTGNRYSPFPEEMNRVILSALAEVHFCPTQKAQRNLLREGVPKHDTFVTGNTSIDALREEWDKNQEFPHLHRYISDLKTVLVTAHRRENFGPKLAGLFQSIRILADENPDFQFIYPVHPNPEVKTLACNILSRHERIHLMEPVSYPELVYLMRHSCCVLTDSGGIQEEAPNLNNLSFAYSNIQFTPAQASLGGTLITASGVLSTGIKARLYQTSGIATPADYSDTANWTETTNRKCYTDSSETALTCGSGIAKPSAGNTRFFLNPTDGHTSVNDWFTGITGQTFSSINIDSDTQF